MKTIMKSKFYFLALLSFVFPCGGVFAADSGGYILDYDSITTGTASSASASYYLEGGLVPIESLGESADYVQEMLPIGNSSICGNNILEEGEECDGHQLDGTTCASFGFNTGTPLCNNDCLSFNTSACSNQSGGSGGGGASGGSAAAPPQHSSQPTSPPQSTPHPTSQPQNTAPPSTPVQSSPDQPLPPGSVNLPQDAPITPQWDDVHPNTDAEGAAPQQINEIKNSPSGASPGNASLPNDQASNLSTSQGDTNDKKSPTSEPDTSSEGHNTVQAHVNNISVFKDFIDRLEPGSPASSAVTGISETVDSVMSAIRDALPFIKNINNENGSKGLASVINQPIDSPVTQALPVVKVQKQLIASDPKPLISGKFALTERAFIRVTDENGNSVLTRDIQQNDDGSFAFIPDKPLADGKFNITVYGMNDGENFKAWERVVIVDRQLEDTIAISRVSLSIEGEVLSGSGEATDIGPIIKKKANQSVITGKTQPQQKIIGYLERTAGILAGDLAAQIFSSQNKTTFPIETISDHEGKFIIALPSDLQSGRYSLHIIPAVENAEGEYVLRENKQVVQFSYATHRVFAPVFTEHYMPPSSFFLFSLIAVTIGVALIGLFIIFTLKRRLSGKSLISKMRLRARGK